MIRRSRVVFAGAVAAMAVGATAGTIATAQAAPQPAPPVPIEPVDLTIAEYWACGALDIVEIGSCLENPLPDLSGLGTLPDLVEALIG